MGIFDALNHLFNFVLPAIGVSLMLALLLRLPVFNRLVTRIERPWHKPVRRNILVGIVVLVAGLVVFGNDGKMATYGALVAAIAVSQWWGSSR